MLVVLYRLPMRPLLRTRMQYACQIIQLRSVRVHSIRYCPIRIRSTEDAHMLDAKFTSALEARASPPPLTVNAPLATRKSEPHACLHEHGARHTAQPSGAHNAAAAVTQRSGQRGRLARAGLALLSTRSRRDLDEISSSFLSRRARDRDLDEISSSFLSRRAREHRHGLA